MEKKWFGIALFDAKDFTELIVRFAFHLVVLLILTRVIYLSKKQKSNYFFTFLLIGIVVFFICFLLKSIKLQLGFALGLFVIFGIIRYRTITIPIKEMTYLFIIIALSIVNALTNKKISYAELIFTNTIILLITYFAEIFINSKNQESIIVIFEKTDILHLNDKAKLIQELEARLNVIISEIKVESIDYKENKAKIKVYLKNEIKTTG